MRPRHYAEDKGVCPARIGRGWLASMRPRHYAEDKATRSGKRPIRDRASMRPRHYAEDKAGTSDGDTILMPGFNEASALRRG